MMDEKDTAIQNLKIEVQAKTDENALAAQQLWDEQQANAATKARLAQSEAAHQQTKKRVAELEAQVQAAADEKAAAEAAAAQRALEPVPPPASEVRAELLAAFDAQMAALQSELAQSAGLSDEDVQMADGDDTFCVGQDGFDSAAMLKAGVPVEEMAKEYLQRAMQRAAASVEPARLQAVAGWQAELRKRRQLQDQLQELKGSIRVMCRVRPLAPSEGPAPVVNVTADGGEVMLAGKDGSKRFAFDFCFGPSSDQAAVFEEVEPVVEQVLAGFNVCIFAYGQTGSGKTHTMQGANAEAAAGINPRALRRLFEAVRERKQMAKLGSNGMATKESGDDGWEYEVSVSYLEIYNETLVDLLVERPKGIDKKPEKLDIKGTGQTVCVSGLSSMAVATAAEVEEAMALGASRRSVTATKMNSASSRSHSIVVVTVTGRNRATGRESHGKLNLVDLAGSERPKKSGVEGQALTEAQNINKSLSALGDVMAALQKKEAHVPFRNSKLTHLLSDSLGGDSKTFMFVNINPAADSAPESLSSLTFAEKVRKVELGKASKKVVEGASQSDLRAAREAEQRAAAEARECKQRCAELEHEAGVLRGSQQRVEAELAQQRKAAAEYRDTEDFLKQQGEERRGTEASQAAKERTLRLAAEKQLKAVAEQLQASQKALATANAATAAAPPAPLALSGPSFSVPWGEAAAQQQQQQQQLQPPEAAEARAATAAAALKQRAAAALDAGASPRGASPRSSGAAAAAAAAAAQSTAPGPLLSLGAGGLMDAPIAFTAGLSGAPTLCLQPPIAPLPMMAQPMAFTQPQPMALQPPSGGGLTQQMRRSPRLAEASPFADGGGTPSSKQPRLGGVDSVRSNKKVTFSFSKPMSGGGAAAAAAAEADEEADDAFPSFAGFGGSAEPSAKENDEASNHALAPPSIRKAAKASPHVATNAFGAAPGNHVPPPPSLLGLGGSLGGPRRAVAGGGGAKRAPSKRLSIQGSQGGAIGKSRGANRRMSLMDRQAGAADALREKRSQQGAPDRRMTFSAFGGP